MIRDTPGGIVTSLKRQRVYARESLSVRFWRKVERGPGCWRWLGSTDDKGYGQIREGGRTGRLLKAHRVSLALALGQVAEDTCVLHRCDNPACVNPGHLFLGTFADNSQDAARKGRLIFQTHPERCPRGERAPGAKLTLDAVRQIRVLRAEGWSQPKLAARFGVTQAAIWSLLHHRTWKESA